MCKNRQRNNCFPCKITLVKECIPFGFLINLFIIGFHSPATLKEKVKRKASIGDRNFIVAKSYVDNAYPACLAYLDYSFKTPKQNHTTMKVTLSEYGMRLWDITEWRRPCAAQFVESENLSTAADKNLIIFVLFNIASVRAR